MSLDKALHLANQGYRVFPVREDKAPLVKRWPERATTDPRAVRSLWEAHPSAGVGIATGDGPTVIDLDRHDADADGVQAFTDWSVANGVDWTPTTTTRNHGQHLYYRASGAYKSRNGILPGVDVKSEGGYVVAYGPVPPLADLPMMSEPLARLLPSKAPKDDQGTAEDSPREIALKAIPVAVEKELDLLESFAQEGQRNAQLNKAAFNLGEIVGDYLDEDETRERLLETALKIGLEYDESVKTIESGLSGGKRHPRTVVEESAASAVIGDGDGSTWSPLPIGDVIAGLLDGTIDRPKPTIGRMDGGGALFYPGKVNGIAGPSGEGKSWVAMLSACQEMNEGNNVVYLDFEDGDIGVLSRFLNDLHMDPETLQDRFTYIHPEERLGKAAEGLTDLIRDLGPSLVVVDSTGESMALEGAKPNDDDETARWFRQVPQRIASLGPAVLVVDHVVKSDDGGLWPIGSQRKRAAINGAQYIQRVVEPFSRGNPGHSKLVCAKDRHGNYAISDLVGTFELTDESEFRLIASVSHISDEDAQRQRLMGKLRRFIEENPGALAGEIRDSSTAKGTTVDAARNALIKGGYVRVESDGRARRHYVTDLPFVPEFEGGGLL